MKYSELIISDMLKQNRCLVFLLFLVILLINCSEKKNTKCDPKMPLSFINIHSEKPIRSIKVYQYKSNILKDSMIFSDQKKDNTDYIFVQDGSNYSVELKKTYTFLDKFKVVIDQNEYTLNDFRVAPSKVGTNYQQENLCEVQEYKINELMVKSNTVLIETDKNEEPQ